MTTSNDSLISALIEKIQNNNDKLDEMKESYYELKYAIQSHQVIDEKMHDEIREFIESANERLDTYNRQLEIHIAATEQNKQEIFQFKQSVEPLLDAYIEDKILEKANKKKINLLKIVLTIVGGIVTIAAAIFGVFKSL